MSVLPKFFHESICHCNGYDETLIEQAHQQAAPISIRLNPYKPTKLNFELDCAVAHSNFGFYINHKPEFTYDINFQAGAYYVQEASSMFIEYVIRQTIDLQKQLTVLDACAAPGGKTTLINSLINSESVLVCNEIEKSRVGALMQNITKWGTHNSIVTNNDTNVFQTLPNMFDLALIDAPCSGSGLFRKMPNYINDWNMNFVNQSFIRQKNILTNIIPSIKEGGILIYSTCSYHIEENENIMDWICDNFNLQNIAIEMPNSFGILESKSKHSQNIGYRCYPYNMKGEGFFCAVFKKQSNENSMPKKKNNIFQLATSFEKNELEKYIVNFNSFEILKYNNAFFLTNRLTIYLLSFMKHCYIKKIGTEVGSLIKSTLIPHHNLALSIYASQNIMPYDCDKEAAICFLKKQPQKIEALLGWILMRYNNFGIGWVKNLENRTNNYLPNEFKIRH